jgi:hypothetical protein
MAQSVGAAPVRRGFNQGDLVVLDELVDDSFLE